MLNYLDYYSFQTIIFMKQDIDFMNLSLHEYRDNFCKDVALDVLKRAYGYSQNGHLPSNAVSTSSVFYAEPKKYRPLLQHGLWAEKKLNAVTIWDLWTETATAQRALLEGVWDFKNRTMCIARLGENYDCKHQTTLDFPNELIIGVYEHRHRFAAVVSIESNHESAFEVRKVQEIADIVAKNAVAYYPKYLHEKEYIAWACKHPHGRQIPPPLPEFSKYLLEQPLRFVKNVNPEYDLSRATKHVVTIEEFIVFRSPAMQKLTIASVDMFGDFEHL